MKKIILIFCLLIACSWAEQKATTINSCNVRAYPNPKATIITQLFADKDLTIIDNYGDWHVITVIGGSSKADDGIEYKIWQGALTNISGTILVKGKGATLRDPETHKSIGGVKGGASVNIEKTFITWYKVQFDNKTGWIYKPSIKIIE